MSAKEKFLKETKSATLVNIGMIRKQSSYLAVMKKVWVVWRDQTSHKILLNQSLTQSKAQPSLIVWRVREVRKLQKKSLKLAEVGSWGLRRKAHFYNKKVQSEASDDGEASVSYPEDLATLNRFSIQTKQPSIGRRCHLCFHSYRGEVNAWLQRTAWLC